MGDSEAEDVMYAAKILGISADVAQKLASQLPSKKQEKKDTTSASSGSRTKDLSKSSGGDDDAKKQSHGRSSSYDKDRNSKRGSRSKSPSSDKQTVGTGASRGADLEQRNRRLRSRSRSPSDKRTDSSGKSRSKSPGSGRENRPMRPKSRSPSSHGGRGDAVKKSRSKSPRTELDRRQPRSKSPLSHEKGADAARKSRSKSPGLDRAHRGWRSRSRSPSARERDRRPDSRKSPGSEQGNSRRRSRSRSPSSRNRQTGEAGKSRSKSPGSEQRSKIRSKSRSPSARERDRQGVGTGKPISKSPSSDKGKSVHSSRPKSKNPSDHGRSSGDSTQPSKRTGGSVKNPETKKVDDKRAQKELLDTLRRIKELENQQLMQDQQLDMMEKALLKKRKLDEDAETKKAKFQRTEGSSRQDQVSHSPSSSASSIPTPPLPSHMQQLDQPFTNQQSRPYPGYPDQQNESQHLLGTQPYASGNQGAYTMPQWQDTNTPPLEETLWQDAQQGFNPTQGSQYPNTGYPNDSQNTTRPQQPSVVSQYRTAQAPATAQYQPDVTPGTSQLPPNQAQAASQHTSSQAPTVTPHQPTPPAPSQSVSQTVHTPGAPQDQEEVQAIEHSPNKTHHKQPSASSHWLYEKTVSKDKPKSGRSDDRERETAKESSRESSRSRRSDRRGEARESSRSQSSDRRDDARESSRSSVSAMDGRRRRDRNRNTHYLKRIDVPKSTLDPGMLCSQCHGYAHYRPDECPMFESKEEEDGKNDNKTWKESELCECLRKPCAGKHHGCKKFGGNTIHCPTVCLKTEEEDKFLYGELVIVEDSNNPKFEERNTVKSIPSLRTSSGMTYRAPLKPVPAVSTKVKVQDTSTKQVEESLTIPQKTSDGSSKRSTIKLNLSEKRKTTLSRESSTKESKVTGKTIPSLIGRKDVSRQSSQTSSTPTDSQVTGKRIPSLIGRKEVIRTSSQSRSIPKEVKGQEVSKKSSHSRSGSKDVKGQSTSASTIEQTVSKSASNKVKDNRDQAASSRQASAKQKKKVWIIGDGTAHKAVLHACRQRGGDSLGLRKDDISLSWRVHDKAKLTDLRDLLTKMLKMAPAGGPDFLVIHLSLDNHMMKTKALYKVICYMKTTLEELVPGCVPIWSEIILQTDKWEKQQPRNNFRMVLNKLAFDELQKLGCRLISHASYKTQPYLYKEDFAGVLSDAGVDRFLLDLKEALLYFQKSDAKDVYVNTEFPDNNPAPSKGIKEEPKPATQCTQESASTKTSSTTPAKPASQGEASTATKSEADKNTVIDNETKPSPPADGEITKVWLVGDSHIHWAAQHALSREEGLQLGVDECGYELEWKGCRDASLANAIPLLDEFLQHPGAGLPHILLVHLGGNDLVYTPKFNLHNMIKDLFKFCKSRLPHTTLVWSFIFSQHFYKDFDRQSVLVQKLSEVNRNARKLCLKEGGKSIAHVNIDRFNGALYRHDDIHLSELGLDVFVNSLKGALEYFHMYPAAVAFPPEWLRR